MTATRSLCTLATFSGPVTPVELSRRPSRSSSATWPASTRTRQVAEQANALGRYDAVIHNAGVGYREPRRVETADGLSQVFAVNVLAPYLLTALITRPSRLVYLSSGMHKSGNPDLDDLQWARRSWNGAQAYADSKLFDVVLAFAVARRWAGRALQCPRARLGADQDGWARRTRRPLVGSGDPGLAGGERRPRSNGYRWLLLPPAAARRSPGSPVSRGSRRFARPLRGAHRGRAPQSVNVPPQLQDDRRRRLVPYEGTEDRTGRVVKPGYRPHGTPISVGEPQRPEISLESSCRWARANPDWGVSNPNGCSRR